MIAIAVVFTFLVPNVNGAVFAGSGVITAKTMRNDVVSYVDNKSFTFTIDSETGRFRIRTVSDAHKAVLLYDEIGFDGVSLFKVRHLNDENLELPNENVALGESHFTPYPLNDSSHIAPLWLAFSSSRFISTNSCECIRPIWGTTPAAVWYEHPRNSYNAVTNSSPPFLPSEVSFSYHGQRFDDRARVFVDLPMDAVNLSGFTNAVYKVHSWHTNIGLALPSTFSLTVFEVVDDESLPPPGLANRTRIKYEGRLNTAELERNPSMSFAPVPPVNTDVFDYRVHSLDKGELFVQYRTSKPAWRKLSDHKKAKAVPFRTQAATGPSHRNRERIGRGIVLVVVLVVPALLLFRKIASRRKKHQ